MAKPPEKFTIVFNDVPFDPSKLPKSVHDTLARATLAALRREREKKLETRKTEPSPPAGADDGTS